ncbi:MAG TPA: polyprenyl synthetase family protein [Thermomicrobiales bacterium]|nr:polyprenyl synthetase family protein [Thermomicrobiales bacterium]
MPLETFDRQLDNAILTAITNAETDAAPSGHGDLPIYDVLRYHLGFVNERFEPERVNAGKRVRPRLCALACEAAGGDPSRAVFAAAAIELLHNFTLIHDDIQDQSVYRRHRRTVWDLWGSAQAINAGDAMFAIAHHALNHSTEAGVDSATVLELSNRLHDATLRIVEGQVLDLGFEQREDVSTANYLTMIGGKTGALTRFACWTGARIAAAKASQVEQLAEFGNVLGVGFQLRDDILGVWGETGDTGKAEADDIRRRKKSLPILLLRERATGPELATLDGIYEHDDVTDDEIQSVLELMRFHEVEFDVQTQVRAWHDRARDLLSSAIAPSPAADELFALVESLERRAG